MKSKREAQAMIVDMKIQEVQIKKTKEKPKLQPAKAKATLRAPMRKKKRVDATRT